MRITTKFVGSSALLIALTAILSGSSYIINRQTGKSLDASYARSQATVSHVVDLSYGLQGQVSALSRLSVLVGNQDEVRRYERSQQLFLSALDDLEQILPEDDQLSRSRLEGIRQLHQYLETLSERVLDQAEGSADDIAADGMAFDSDRVEEMTRSLRLFEDQSDHYVRDLLDAAQEQTHVYSQQQQVVRQQTAMLELLSFSLVILLLFAQYYGLLCPVMRSLLQLQSGAEAIGKRAQLSQQIAADGVEAVPVALLPKIHLKTKDELRSVAESFNQMSDHLAASYHNLELKVAERTQSLNYANESLLEEVRDRIETEKELSLAIKQLQQTQLQLLQTEKLSSLNQLVAGVAHEINNPVSFIQGNLEPAQSYMDSLLRLLKSYRAECPEASDELQAAGDYADLAGVQEDFPQLLAAIGTGAERITTIVRSLQTFSHADESETKSVDLHQGLDSVLLILTSQLIATADREAINVICDYGDLPKVYCYPSQLNQVFMSLLTNAIDAFDPANSPEDGDGSAKGMPQNVPQDPTIRITTEADTDWLRVTIADNGMGMAEETRRQMFDPFFTTKPVGTGTGLGLSISHQIVIGNHKGRFTCQSECGVGTTITVEIPRSLKIQHRSPVDVMEGFLTLPSVGTVACDRQP